MSIMPNERKNVQAIVDQIHCDKQQANELIKTLKELGFLAAECDSLKMEFIIKIQNDMDQFNLNRFDTSSDDDVKWLIEKLPKHKKQITYKIYIYPTFLFKISKDNKNA